MDKKIFTLICALNLFIFTVALNAQNFYDASGSLVGRIDEDGGIRTSSGSLPGSVKSSGKVFDKGGSVLGWIKGDGTVQNHHGEVIGYAEGIKIEWIAYLYFFK